MKINRHLQEHEITAAVANLEVEAAVREHLSSCLLCQRRVASMDELFQQRRAEMLRSSPDWERQRRQILEALPSAPVVPIVRRRWVAPLMAAAAALFLAVGLGIFSPGTSDSPVMAPPVSPTVAVATAATLDVEKILAEVEATLDGDDMAGFQALGPLLPDLDELEGMFGNGAS